MASTHELSILVTAKGAIQAARNLGKVDSAMGGIARRAGQGLKTAGANLAKFGLIAGGVVVAGIKQGLDSLATLESATTSVDAAIRQMGISGQVTASTVASWANEIEASVGAAFDDKDIISATSTLIRFGKITPANLRPAMVVMTDLAAKTGDVKSASSLLAKALADPAKAAGKLARVGVILTKEQQKQVAAFVKAGKAGKAQKVILDALAETTKGAAAATQGPYQRAMSVLADVTEDAERALAEGFLPVLEKVADLLSKELAKPATIKNIREFGKGLAKGLDNLIDMARGLPWASIGDAMKLAGQGAKAALDLFNGMPDWVKTAVLTGWGLNKLTGGALGGIVGELGKGLIRGVLGINAGVVNIRAASVVGGGAAAGPGGVATAGRAGGVARAVRVLGTVALAATSIVAIAELWKVRQQQSEANRAAEGTQRQQTQTFVGGASVKEMSDSLNGIERYTNDLVHGSKQFTAEAVAFGLNIDGIYDHVQGIKKDLEEGIDRGTLQEAKTLAALHRIESTPTELARLRQQQSIANDRSVSAVERVRSAVNAQDLSVKITNNVRATANVTVRDTVKATASAMTNSYIQKMNNAGLI